jgi:hypothetical protein
MESQAILTAAFVILVIAVVGGAGFLVFFAIQIRHITVTVTDFCRHTDEKLMPALEETEKTLKSIRVVANDMGAITANMREVTDAVCEVAVNIRAVSSLVNDVREKVSLKTLGIKAGVQAALGMLLKNTGDRR